MQAALVEMPPPALHVVAPPPASKERDLIALALDALKSEQGLFTRKGRLVEVRGTSNATIVPLERYGLRERFFSNEHWQQALSSRHLRSPAWLELMLLKRGAWEGLRPLQGLIHAPMLRPDGSVITSSGYDEATGLYLADAPPISLPAQPTQADAQEAYRRLLDFSKSLPLQSSATRAAFIASLLTPLARLAMDGPAPLFLFDAPTDRTPPLLADAVSLIIRGTPVTQMEKPPSDRVFRRRVAQAELNDETMILVEGAETYRSGEALKTGLFHRAWVDGSTRAKESHPVTWYASGINVSLTREVSPLVLPIRAEATEDENGQPLWVPPPAFEQSVLRERPQLLEAALTLLSAYVTAGRPTQKVGSLPRFEAWVNLVPSAIVWAGGKNPLATRESLPDYVDDDRAELQALLTSFGQIPSEAQGLTVKELLARLEGEEPWAQPMRDALEAMKPGEWRVSRKLGDLLKRVRGRRVDGMFIERVGWDRKGYARWSVCADHRSPPELVAQVKALETAVPAESADSIHATDDENVSPEGGRGREPSGTTEQMRLFSPAERAETSNGLTEAPHPALPEGSRPQLRFRRKA